jgi:four helix bundle protein
MPARRFDELPVWRAAIELAAGIFDLGARGAFRGHPGLRDQLERAVISISNNIAEGHERGTNEELLTFLYYARGSAGEVRSMLLFLARAGEWARLRDDVTSLTSLCLSVARQLGGWIESIKNSNHPDQRRENEATRGARQSAQRQAAFMEELRRISRERRPDPPPSDATSDV